MAGIKGALEAFAADLTAAGFGQVSAEPAELSPEPVAVWLQPRSVDDVTLSRSATLTVWVWLICGNFDVPQVLDLLDDALAGLLELDAVALADTDPPIDLGTPVLLPHTATPLPAYRVAVALDLDL